jgi:Arc/MetJ family transcription regulator
MVKTPVEIGQEALALAAKVLGTKTKKDTGNAALREVGQRLDRLRALARLRELADQGDFDEFVGDKAAYRPSTRPCSLPIPPGSSASFRPRQGRHGTSSWPQASPQPAR